MSEGNNPSPRARKTYYHYMDGLTYIQFKIQSMIHLPNDIKDFSHLLICITKEKRRGFHDSPCSSQMANIICQSPKYNFVIWP